MKLSHKEKDNTIIELTKDVRDKNKTMLEMLHKHDIEIYNYSVSESVSWCVSAVLLIVLFIVVGYPTIVGWFS